MNEQENQQLKEQFIATSKGLKKVIVKRKKWKRKYLKEKNKNKQLKTHLQQKDSIIEEAINKIEYLRMEKWFIQGTDIMDVLDILNKYKGDNN